MGETGGTVRVQTIQKDKSQEWLDRGTSSCSGWRCEAKCEQAVEAVYLFIGRRLRWFNYL